MKVITERQGSMNYRFSTLVVAVFSPFTLKEVTYEAHIVFLCMKKYNYSLFPGSMCGTSLVRRSPSIFSYFSFVKRPSFPLADRCIEALVEQQRLFCLDRVPSFLDERSKKRKRNTFIL